MTCDHCGTYSPADPDTGYDADALCPECEAMIDALDDYGATCSEPCDEEA